MTVVYVDSVFVLNALMDYLLVLCAARLAGIPLRRRRYLLAGLLGGAYAVAVFLPGLGFLSATPVKLAAGILLALAAYGGEAKLLRLTLLLFAVTCAPNYSRPTFAEQSGLEIRPSSVDELTELCLSLLQRTNEARDALGEQNTTGMSFSETSKRVQSAFHALSSEYPFLGQPPIAAKPMIFSEILSSFNLTGFYFPYTAEANVNVHMPDTELPFTIGHELAHTCGFMREDEANFIGYLACLRSDEPYIRYSGLYCALSYSMNALYSVSPERYFAIRKHYHERLKADAAALSAYWQPYFHTPAAKLSDAVNDTYLKANNLTDGVHSYGRMVDLLLAEARAEISDTTL